MNARKRLLSLLLALCMVLALVPAAFAEDGPAYLDPETEPSELMEEEAMGDDDDVGSLTDALWKNSTDYTTLGAEETAIVTFELECVADDSATLASLTDFDGNPRNLTAWANWMTFVVDLHGGEKYADFTAGGGIWGSEGMTWNIYGNAYDSRSDYHAHTFTVFVSNRTSSAEILLYRDDASTPFLRWYNIPIVDENGSMGFSISTEYSILKDVNISTFPSIGSRYLDESWKDTIDWTVETNTSKTVTFTNFSGTNAYNNFNVVLKSCLNSSNAVAAGTYRADGFAWVGDFVDNLNTNTNPALVGTPTVDNSFVSSINKQQVTVTVYNYGGTAKIEAVANNGSKLTYSDIKVNQGDITFCLTVDQSFLMYNKTAVTTSLTTPVTPSVGGYLKTSNAIIKTNLMWNVFFAIDSDVISDPVADARIAVTSNYDTEINDSYTLAYDETRSAYYITVPIRPRLIDQAVSFSLVSADGNTTYPISIGEGGETADTVSYTFNDYLTQVATNNTYSGIVTTLRAYRDALLDVWPVNN